MNAAIDFDKKIQTVLYYLYINRLNANSLGLNNEGKDDGKSRWTISTLHTALKDEEVTPSILQDILAILYSDEFLDGEEGFIKSLHIPNGYTNQAFFSISPKGIAFVFRGTYNQRRRNDNLQLDLLKSQIETNRISKTTNIYIAIFTSIAGLYYISQLAITLLPDGMPYRTLFIYLLPALSLIGCILGMGVIKRKRKGK